MLRRLPTIKWTIRVTIRAGRGTFFSAFRVMDNGAKGIILLALTWKI
jgi:hypothetical protein